MVGIAMTILDITLVFDGCRWPSADRLLAGTLELTPRQRKRSAHIARRFRLIYHTHDNSEASS
jgi:hypothetical protein